MKVSVLFLFSFIHFAHARMTYFFDAFLKNLRALTQGQYSILCFGYCLYKLTLAYVGADFEFLPDLHQFMKSFLFQICTQFSLLQRLVCGTCSLGGRTQFSGTFCLVNFLLGWDRLTPRDFNAGLVCTNGASCAARA